MANPRLSKNIITATIDRTQIRKKPYKFILHCDIIATTIHSRYPEEDMCQILGDMGYKNYYLQIEELDGRITQKMFIGDIHGKRLKPNGKLFKEYTWVASCDFGEIHSRNENAVEDMDAE